MIKLSITSKHGLLLERRSRAGRPERQSQFRHLLSEDSFCQLFNFSIFQLFHLQNNRVELESEF